eukprot:scaffold21556_cov120-Isochrysis_galbana.AAC.1
MPGRDARDAIKPLFKKMVRNRGVGGQNGMLCRRPGGSDPSWRGLILATGFGAVLREWPPPQVSLTFSLAPPPGKTVRHGGGGPPGPR